MHRRPMWPLLFLCVSGVAAIIQKLMLSSMSGMSVMSKTDTDMWIGDLVAFLTENTSSDITKTVVLDSHRNVLEAHVENSTLNVPEILSHPDESQAQHLGILFSVAEKIVITARRNEDTHGTVYQFDVSKNLVRKTTDADAPNGTTVKLVLSDDEISRKLVSRYNVVPWIKKNMLVSREDKINMYWGRKKVRDPALPAAFGYRLNKNSFSLDMGRRKNREELAKRYANAKTRAGPGFNAAFAVDGKHFDVSAIFLKLPYQQKEFDWQESYGRLVVHTSSGILAKVAVPPEYDLIYRNLVVVVRTKDVNWQTFYTLEGGRVVEKIMREMTAAVIESIEKMYEEAVFDDRLREEMKMLTNPDWCNFVVNQAIAPEIRRRMFGLVMLKKMPDGALISVKEYVDAIQKAHPGIDKIYYTKIPMHMWTVNGEIHPAIDGIRYPVVLCDNMLLMKAFEEMKEYRGFVLSDVAKEHFVFLERAAEDEALVPLYRYLRSYSPKIKVSRRLVASPLAFMESPAKIPLDNMILLGEYLENHVVKLSQQPILEVNVRHPAVKKILELAKTDEERAGSAAFHLFLHTDALYRVYDPNCKQMSVDHYNRTADILGLDKKKIVWNEKDHSVAAFAIENDAAREDFDDMIKENIVSQAIGDGDYDPEYLEFVSKIMADAKKVQMSQSQPAVSQRFDPSTYL